MNCGYQMTRMYLMHGALRRELDRMARATARALYRSEWQPAYAALDLWHERSAW